jgi:hypothetical protein
MAVYTVHEPPPKRYESAADPARFAFVRDGFSLWAFLFGPLWMLRHRMWLVLLGYAAVMVAVELALRAVGASAGAGFTVGLLLGILLGVEASTLRRFTLGRRKWTNVGTVVGDNLESAERRFFDAWARGEIAAPPQPVKGQLYLPPAASDVIGLFPEPRR